MQGVPKIVLRTLDRGRVDGKAVLGDTRPARKWAASSPLQKEFTPTQVGSFYLSRTLVWNALIRGRSSAAMRQWVASVGSITPRSGNPGLYSWRVFVG